MNGFQQYPKALRNDDGNIKIVQNMAEEQKLACLGYAEPGTANPAAFLKASDQPIEIEHREWPKYINGKVVHNPRAPPPKPAGAYPRWVNGKVVETEEDDIEALMEADEEMRTPAFQRAEEKAELLKRATTLGIKTDSRWGMQRLREVVAAGQRAAGEGSHRDRT